MAFRRLINQINLLSGDGDVRGLRNDRGNMVGLSDGLQTTKAFVDQAIVGTVNGDGSYTLVYRGMQQKSFGTTDEPIRAGQVVYMSKTERGNFVVHGSAG